MGVAFQTINSFNNNTSVPFEKVSGTYINSYDILA